MACAIPQFTADEGGQLTATLKHESDRGQLILYARYLDDKNQFITPIPLIQRGTDNFSAYPGFDPLTATYNSEAIRHVRLDGYPNGGTNADLADGRGAQMLFLGANFDHDFDNGWSISNKFLANGGDVDTNALFSGTNPATLFDKLYTIPTNLGGFQLPPDSATATFVGGGAVAPTQDVIHQGWWFIHKELASINNDFRLSKELFEDNTLTVGLYLAYYEMDDEWALGNQMFMTNEPNATADHRELRQRRSDLSADRQSRLPRQRRLQHHAARPRVQQRDLSVRFVAYRQVAAGRLRALRESGRHQPRVQPDEPRSRWQSVDALQQRCGGVQRNAGHHGLRRRLHLVDGGRELQLHRLHVCVCSREQRRALRGFRQRHSRQHHRQYAADQEIENYEVGFKFQNDFLYADISAYFRDFTGLHISADRRGRAHRSALGSSMAPSRTGVNFIGALTLGENFRFQVVANYLDGEYTDFDACFPFTNVVTGNGCAPIEGQQLQRQPKERYVLTPSYRLPLAFGDIEAYVTYTYVGDHTQDQSGLQQLGTYYTWDFGVTASVGENWQFTVRGTNVTDELGLTESNSRIFGVAAGAGGVLLARPLEGSEINFQAKYLW